MHAPTPHPRHPRSARMTLLAVLAVLALGGTYACSDDPSDAPTTEAVRVAFVYVGPISDVGWTYAHNEGRLAAEALLQNVETFYLESVPEDTSADTIQSLVDEGYDLIFTTSFGYMDATAEIAAANPDTRFEHCSGYKTGDNLSNYFGRIYQAQYLAGIVAGRMTTSNKLGYLAPFPIPEVYRGINAFTLGARSVNPDAEVHVRWVLSWYDPDGETTLSNELLTTVGVDVLRSAVDSTASLVAAREAGAYFIGYDSDPLSFEPATVLTSTIWDWGIYYADRIKAVQDGTWTSHAYWGGMETGIVKLGLYGEAVPQAVRDEVATIEASIVDGSFNVFSGPIMADDGSEWVADGVTLTDAELLSMDQLVEGAAAVSPAP